MVNFLGFRARCGGLKHLAGVETERYLTGVDVAVIY